MSYKLKSLTYLCLFVFAGILHTITSDEDSLKNNSEIVKLDETDLKQTDEPIVIIDDLE